MALITASMPCLKPLREQVTAILAPKGYMDETEAHHRSQRPGDRHRLLDLRSNKPFLLAMDVSGDRTMKLREASGRPAWAVGDDWHIHSAAAK